MKKVLTVLMILVSGAAVLFAKTYTAYTDHFDIIYTDESVKSADVIYKNCEQIYSEIADLVGYDGNISIPVYLNKDNKILNGKETQFPYNRIVINDTTPQIGSQTYFKNQVLTIFRHELTHALMFEIKPNKILKAGSWFFGDWFGLEGVYLYPSYVEGAAVMSESLSGFGRLHNTFAMQIVHQAKLEDNMPTFFQALGSRDIYPGSYYPYIFGGAFSEYLRNTYGEEKLREFYNRTGKFEWSAFTGLKFSKTFGIKEDFAWTDFCNSIKLPESCIEANIISKLGRFSTIKLVDGKIYALDSEKNKVFTLEKGKFVSQFNAISSEDSLSIDSDKNTLILENNLTRSSMVLRDSLGTVLYTFKDYRDGTIAESNGKKYYCLYRNESQDTFIDIYDAEFNIIDTVELGWTVFASDFCNPMNEVVAFLKSFEGKRSIVFYNIATKKIVEADNPNNLYITSINSSPTPEEDWKEDSIEELEQVYRGLVTFSWTEENSDTAFIRYGEMHLKKIGLILSLKQSLSYVDINGSVDHPVMENGNVTYIGKFFENDAICCVNTSDLRMTAQKLIEVKPYNQPVYEDMYGDITIKGRRYSAGKYFFDGSVIPLSFSESSDSSLPAGLSFMTKDPTEVWDYTGSFGYFIKTKQFSSYNFISATFDKYFISAKMQLDWPMLYTKSALTFSYTKPLSTPGKNLIVSNTLSESSSVLNLTEALELNDTIAVSLKNTVNAGLKKFDYKGYTLYADATFRATTSREASKQWDQLKFKKLNAYVAARADFPSLGCAHYSILGFGNIEKGDFGIAGAQLEIMPLSLEIQNGLSVVGMYFNRFVIDLYAVGQYNIKKSDLDYYVVAKSYLTLSETIGMAAYHHVDLGMSCSFDVKNMKFGGVNFYYNLNLDSLGIKGNCSPVER